MSTIKTLTERKLCLQGHSRRIKVRVKTVTESGTLPLIPDTITSVSIGGITNRSKLQKGLDSYQEDDLTGLRERWSDALAKRTKYLNEQIQNLINKPGNISDTRMYSAYLVHGHSKLVLKCIRNLLDIMSNIDNKSNYFIPGNSPVLVYACLLYW